MWRWIEIHWVGIALGAIAAGVWVLVAEVSAIVLWALVRLRGG